MRTLVCSCCIGIRLRFFFTRRVKSKTVEPDFSNFWCFNYLHTIDECSAYDIAINSRNRKTLTVLRKKVVKTYESFRKTFQEKLRLI